MYVTGTNKLSRFSEWQPLKSWDGTIADYQFLTRQMKDGSVWTPVAKLRSLQDVIMARTPNAMIFETVHWLDHSGNAVPISDTLQFGDDEAPPEPLKPRELPDINTFVDDDVIAPSSESSGSESETGVRSLNPVDNDEVVWTEDKPWLAQVVNTTAKQRGSVPHRNRVTTPPLRSKTGAARARSAPTTSRITKRPQEGVHFTQLASEVFGVDHSESEEEVDLPAPRPLTPPKPRKGRVSFDLGGGDQRSTKEKRAARAEPPPPGPARYSSDEMDTWRASDRVEADLAGIAAEAQVASHSESADDTEPETEQSEKESTTEHEESGSGSEGSSDNGGEESSDSDPPGGPDPSGSVPPAPPPPPAAPPSPPPPDKGKGVDPQERPSQPQQLASILKDAAAAALVRGPAKAARVQLLDLAPPKRARTISLPAAAVAPEMDAALAKLKEHEPESAPEAVWSSEQDVSKRLKKLKSNMQPLQLPTVAQAAAKHLPEAVIKTAQGSVTFARTTSQQSVASEKAVQPSKGPESYMEALEADSTDAPSAMHKLYDAYLQAGIAEKGVPMEHWGVKTTKELAWTLKFNALYKLTELDKGRQPDYQAWMAVKLAGPALGVPRFDAVAGAFSREAENSEQFQLPQPVPGQKKVKVQLTGGSAEAEKRRRAQGVTRTETGDKLGVVLPEVYTIPGFGGTAATTSMDKYLLKFYMPDASAMPLQGAQKAQGEAWVSAALQARTRTLQDKVDWANIPSWADNRNPNFACKKPDAALTLINIKAAVFLHMGGTHQKLLEEVIRRASARNMPLDRVVAHMVRDGEAYCQEGKLELTGRFAVDKNRPEPTQVATTAGKSMSNVLGQLVAGHGKKRSGDFPQLPPPVKNIDADRKLPPGAIFKPFLKVPPKEPREPVGKTVAARMRQISYAQRTRKNGEKFDVILWKNGFPLAERAGREDGDFTHLHECWVCGAPYQHSHPGAVVPTQGGTIFNPPDPKHPQFVGDCPKCEGKVPGALNISTGTHLIPVPVRGGQLMPARETAHAKPFHEKEGRPHSQGESSITHRPSAQPNSNLAVLQDLAGELPFVQNLIAVSCTKMREHTQELYDGLANINVIKQMADGGAKYRIPTVISELRVALLKALNAICVNAPPSLDRKPLVQLKHGINNALEMLAKDPWYTQDELLNCVALERMTHYNATKPEGVPPKTRDDMLVELEEWTKLGLLPADHDMQDSLMAGIDWKGIIGSEFLSKFVGPKTFRFPIREEPKIQRLDAETIMSSAKKEKEVAVDAAKKVGFGIVRSSNKPPELPKKPSIQLRGIVVHDSHGTVTGAGVLGPRTPPVPSVVSQPVMSESSTRGMDVTKEGQELGFDAWKEIPAELLEGLPTQKESIAGPSTGSSGQRQATSSPDTEGSGHEPMAVGFTDPRS